MAMRNRKRFLVLCLGALCSWSWAAAVAQPAVAGCGDTRTTDPGRLLLGELDGGEPGKQMLLFCTDKNGNITAMFEPPGFLALQQRVEGEEIKLQSETLPNGRFYLFTGRKSSKAITGKIELCSTGGGSEVLAAETTLRTLNDLLDSRPGSGARLRHYSNVRFVEESGDLIGSEIWIASRKEKGIGFIVFYESYWGEATQTPLAMNRLSRTPLGWRFELEGFGIQGHKTGQYRLQRTHGGAILYRLDIEKETRNGIRLKVRRKLGQSTSDSGASTPAWAKPAQSGDPASPQSANTGRSGDPGAAPAGVLLGLKLVQSPGMSHVEGNHNPELAETDRNRSELDTVKVNSRSNQAETESPFQTAWIQIAGDKVKVRWLQDVIVPRTSGIPTPARQHRAVRGPRFSTPARQHRAVRGPRSSTPARQHRAVRGPQFWRFGKNTDSVGTNRGLIQEDFFWATPLDEKPKLKEVDDLEECDGEARRRTQDVHYVGPSYIARSTESHSLSDCSSFSSSSVVSLDQPNGDNVPISKVIGPVAGDKVQQLNREVSGLKPRKGEDCGQDGWEAEEKWWTLKHTEGRWRVFIELIPRNGGRLCRVISQERELNLPLQALPVYGNRLPMAWKDIKALVPEATDAFASPGGEIVLVVAPNKILVARPQAGKLRQIDSFATPDAVPVMAEWALGSRVARWDETLSTLPGPKGDSATNTR